MKFRTSTLFLLIVLAGALLIIWRQCRDRERLKEDNSRLREQGVQTAEVIKEYVSTDTVHHTVFKNVYSDNVAVSDKLLDSIIVALNIRDKQLQEYRNITAALKGKLRAAEVRKDTVHKNVYMFRDRWLQAEMKEADSSLVYQYNAEMNLTKYWYRDWFLGGKNFAVDISFKDPNFKVNGMKQIEIRERVPGRFSAGVHAGYYFDLETGTFRPAVGAGISYNFIRF